LCFQQGQTVGIYPPQQQGFGNDGRENRNYGGRAKNKEELLRILETLAPGAAAPLKPLDAQLPRQPSTWHPWASSATSAALQVWLLCNMLTALVPQYVILHICAKK
jgi:hypothetical protein